VVEKLDQAMGIIRNEDLARWGAFLIEDLGVIEIDRAVGQASHFGASIRRELCGSEGMLNEKWVEVASRVLLHSPGAAEPTNLLGTLCLLATAELFISGEIHASTRH
jgi:hypothetical protein